MSEETKTKLPEKGVNVLLYGGTGVGKTTSIRTAVHAGLKTFVLFTEPGQGTFSKFTKEERDAIHWCYVPAIAQSISDLAQTGKFIARSSYKAIAGYKDPKKQRFDQFPRALEALANFTDQHGEQFGAVDSWDSNHFLFVDGLSGWNQAALNMMTGSRPAADISDYGVAMRYLEAVIDNLIMNCNCHFTLIAHAEREHDEILGRTTVMPGALGRKLSPVIGRNFDEVILAKRNADKFYWSTTDPQADTKARYLALSDDLPQDFKPIIDAWRNTI